MNPNAAILTWIGLLWSAGCLVFRLWFRQNKKLACSMGEQLPNAWITTLIGLGLGIFTAWLILILLGIENRFFIQILGLIGVVPGFCFILSPANLQKSHGPLILEAFANHFGLFHIRLDGHERLVQNWEGHTLGELDLRKKNLLVLTIIRGEEIIPFPKGPEMLRHFDDLLIFGSMNELGLADLPK